MFCKITSEFDRTVKVESLIFWATPISVSQGPMQLPLSKRALF
jgi:hypothetical protein